MARRLPLRHSLLSSVSSILEHSDCVSLCWLVSWHLAQADTISVPLLSAMFRFKFMVSFRCNLQRHFWCAAFFEVAHLGSVPVGPLLCHRICSDSLIVFSLGALIYTRVCVQAFYTVECMNTPSRWNGCYTFVIRIIVLTVLAIC